MSAEPAPVLRLVGCEECERRDRALQAALVDLENIGVDLTIKRRRIKQLENELAERRRTDPMYDTAERIFEFWREKCQPSARTFSEDRLKAVLARLKDKTADGEVAYDPRFICEAILGASVAAYVDEKGKRHCDLELICRTGRKLEDFRERWRTHKANQGGPGSELDS